MSVTLSPAVTTSSRSTMLQFAAVRCAARRIDVPLVAAAVAFATVASFAIFVLARATGLTAY